jgi:hypothetical protein
MATCSALNPSESTELLQAGTIQAAGEGMETVGVMEAVEGIMEAVAGTMETAEVGGMAMSQGVHGMGVIMIGGMIIGDE